MDNASKALIIAGGMLIAIMVASLFVYLFTTYGNYAENMYDRINQKQITNIQNTKELLITQFMMLLLLQIKLKIIILH